MCECWPSFTEQLAEARKLSDADLHRHALVAIRHCKCGDCFCCACLRVERERSKEAARTAPIPSPRLGGRFWSPGA